MIGERCNCSFYRYTCIMSQDRSRGGARRGASWSARRGAGEMAARPRDVAVVTGREPPPVYLGTVELLDQRPSAGLQIGSQRGGVEPGDDGLPDRAGPLAQPLHTRWRRA